MTARVTALLLMAGLTLAAWAQPSIPNTPGFDVRANGIDQKLGDQLPMDLEFQDETGKTVKLGDLFQGRPMVFHPVWYGCTGTCQLSSEGLIKSFLSMKYDYPGESFDVITFSIKPNETSKMAAERKKLVFSIYKKPQAEKGWHFLTGSLDSITKLTTALGFRYTYNPELDQINHPSGIMVATEEGKISKYLYGTEYNAKFMLRTLEAAADKRIQEKSEPILLGCFQFDPASGKYRLVLWRAVQVGGVATVLLLAASIAVMSIRHRTPRVSKAGGQKSK